MMFPLFVVMLAMLAPGLTIFFVVVQLTTLLLIVRFCVIILHLIIVLF